MNNLLSVVYVSSYRSKRDARVGRSVCGFGHISSSSCRFTVLKYPLNNASQPHIRSFYFHVIIGRSPSIESRRGLVSTAQCRMEGAMSLSISVADQGVIRHHRQHHRATMNYTCCIFSFCLPFGKCGVCRRKR